MTSIILTYYSQRTKYLDDIIKSLRKSTVETDIIVFNQGAIINERTDITVINSSVNFGCSIRHALALAINDDCFFFQDDDLLVMPDTISELQKYVRDSNVVGVMGSTLTDGYYTTSINGTKTSSVDIVVGRVHMCRKQAIINAFQLRDKLKLKIFREDDILLSLANSGNYMVSTPIISLPEDGIGLSYDEYHYKERNFICKLIYDNNH